MLLSKLRKMQVELPSQSTKEMSYNWIDAATPQGRERLKELLDKGIRVVGKVGQYGRITAFWKHEDGAYDVDCYLPEPFFLERNLSDVEFLDPDQDSQIEALKSENEQLVKICQDSAGKEVVDKLLHDRQVSELLAEIDHLKKLLVS